MHRGPHEHKSNDDVRSISNGRLEAGSARTTPLQLWPCVVLGGLATAGVHRKCGDAGAAVSLRAGAETLRQRPTRSSFMGVTLPSCLPPASCAPHPAGRLGNKAHGGSDPNGKRIFPECPSATQFRCQPRGAALHGTSAPLWPQSTQKSVILGAPRTYRAWQGCMCRQAKTPCGLSKSYGICSASIMHTAFLRSLKWVPPAMCMNRAAALPYDQVAPNLFIFYPKPATAVPPICPSLSDAGLTTPPQMHT